MGKFDLVSVQPALAQGRTSNSRADERQRTKAAASIRHGLPRASSRWPRAILPVALFLACCLTLLCFKRFADTASLRFKQFSAGKNTWESDRSRRRIPLLDELPRRKWFFVGKHAGMEEQLPLSGMPGLGRRTVYRDKLVGPREWPGPEEYLEFLDVEAEYSNRVAQAMKAAAEEHPYLGNARANAAIFALCTNAERHGMIAAIEQVDASFNSRYNYPYVLVNDVPFNDLFKKSVAAATNSTVEFGVVPREHWSLPGFINAKAYKERLEFPSTAGENLTRALSPSYHLMCRYYSMYFFQHPLMLKYRYYMRIEAFTEYSCTLRYDPFLFMALYNKKYGYAIVAEEDLGTVTGIWKVAQDYMYEHGINKSSFFMMLHDKNMGGYNGIQLWDNFEMADLDFLRSREYMGFMEALERSKGFFFQRYGDAPVRTLAVAMLLQPNETHYFVDLGYRHGHYKTCPISDVRGLEEFKKLCACERDSAWWLSEGTDGGWSRYVFSFVNNVNLLWDK